MVGTDPAPFGAGTSEPNVTLDTSHHAGGLRPIESMAAAQMQQLETNVVQRRPEQQPSAAAAANVFTTAQHASQDRVSRLRRLSECPHVGAPVSEL